MLETGHSQQLAATLDNAVEAENISIRASDSLSEE